MVKKLASRFVRVEKNEWGSLEGNFLDQAGPYMPMHTGTLPPKTTVDWAYYDSLPCTSMCLSECFESLLKNPAYSLLLHNFLTGVTKRYRSSDGQIQLYLLINDTAIQVKDDVLTIYGNNAWAEQQLKQSIDLYRHLGQPPITEYHIRIQGQQVIAYIADQIVHLAP